MTMRLFWLVALATVTSACLGVRGDPRFPKDPVENRPLKFSHDIRLYALKNGMTVALLPDSRTNLVTVDARYRVGSADDPSGRAGLAHLVEHLTFEARTGTDGATLGDRLGEAALQYNAFTSPDGTHYTATALASRLADVLELEAQRLEMTCAQLDDGIFGRERKVVLAEVAERRSAWSDIYSEISRQVWGKDHPYARGVGEVADAARDEVCRFFGSHYAPDRLVLVVTGDFDPEPISYAIGKRFARITRKSDTPPAAIQTARLTGTQSRHRADVDDAFAMVFFPAPPWGSDDAVLHQLALLRLNQVMAQADHEEDWIEDVGVTTVGTGQARLIAVTVSVDEPQRLDDAVEEVFDRAPLMFDDVGPYLAANLISKLQAGYVASYESFSGRGPWLADYLTYTQHNSFMVPELESLVQTTMLDADRYARKNFLLARSHVARVEPSGKEAMATQAAVASDREPDLAPWRTPIDPAEAQRALPAPTQRVHRRVSEMVMENGLRVILAPDPTSSLVDARLVFPHGSASEPSDRRGLASAAATLLESDPDRRYRSNDVLLLGWGMSVGTQLDQEVYETSTVFSARGASNRADWHVWRLWWLIEQCRYLDDEVDTFRDNAIRASAEEAEPAMALTRELLFGAGHPYSTPQPTGEQWNWLTWRELERYREAHYVPRGATLIISGGFDPNVMRGNVLTLFGPWAGKEEAVPRAALPAARPAQGPSWIGTRDPSLTQVGLLVAFATASDRDRDKAARLVLKEMVTDRLRIVREGMGATYSVQVSYATGTGGGAFYVSSDLDPARAAKASTAILSELEALRTGAGAMAADFGRARRRALATALADAAGVSAVADELEYVVRQGLPVDYIDQLAVAISKVTPAEVAAVAAADLDRSRRVVSVDASPERLDAVMKEVGATQPRIFDKKKKR